MNDPAILEDGRINLPPTTAEALERAARDCLGPAASEALLGDDGAKLFKGMEGGFFLQGPDEGTGTEISRAAPELQERLMRTAARLRASQREAELAPYRDPTKNDFIKRGE